MGIEVGNRVSWNTSQGRTRGKVIDERTKRFTFAGQKFNASTEEPYYIVESDMTGARAAHKGSSLNKLKS